MQTHNTSQQRDQSEIQHAVGGYVSGGGGGYGAGWWQGLG